jgi:cell division protein FtsB
MSSFDVLISTEVLEKLKRDYEELKKENEELKKRLESYEKRPREEYHSYPLQFNRRKDYCNWIKEVEEEMR